jgi:hypothetical protein
MFKKMLAVAALAVSFSSNAAFISNSEIDSIAVDAPSGWTSINSSALFDGNTSRTDGQRFVGFRNSGGALSSANPFVITVSLTKLFDITSFSIFNDFGQSFRHHVDSIMVSLFDTSSGSAVSQGSFSSSNVDSTGWNEFVLFDGLVGTSVDQIQITIDAIDGINFELREFLVEFVETDSNAINAPATFATFAMFLIALVSIRKAKS